MPPLLDDKDGGCGRDAGNGRCVACSLCRDLDGHNVMSRRKMNGKAGSKASIQRGFAVGHKGNMP